MQELYFKRSCSGTSGMVLDQHTLMLWFGRFLWPFLRITGLFLTAPLYGQSFIPGMVKAFLAAGLALSLAMWLPDLPPYPADPLNAILTGFEQILYGVALGMTMQIILAVFSCAGEIIGQVMGLSFADLQFKATSGASSVFSDIMFWPGLLGFMAVGGPIWLFAALAHSFAHGTTALPLSGWGNLAMLGSTLFSAAAELALPVMAVTLCVNLTVGLTTVFAPSMNLLSIGFPLLILSGLWVLAAEVPMFNVVIHHLMQSCEVALGNMLPHG